MPFSVNNRKASNQFSCLPAAITNRHIAMVRRFSERFQREIRGHERVHVVFGVSFTILLAAILGAVVWRLYAIGWGLRE